MNYERAYLRMESETLRSRSSLQTEQAYKLLLVLGCIELKIIDRQG